MQKKIIFPFLLATALTLALLILPSLAQENIESENQRIVPEMVNPGKSVANLTNSIAECSVLVVDDDWDFISPNGGGRPYYTSTLDYLGYPFVLWDTVSMGTPSALDMAPYNVVIWFTGYDWLDPISPSIEGPELAAYLDNGGNVFMSSQDQNFVYGLTPLMTDYFWIDSINDDVVSLGIQGNLSDPLYSSHGSYKMGRPDGWDPYWPIDEFEGPYDDEVFSKLGGYEPLVYTNTQTSNSTRFKNMEFKTMYLGFPFEWIVELNDRSEILGKALKWFCSYNITPARSFGSEIAGSSIAYTLTISNSFNFTETFAINFNSDWSVDGPANIGPIPADGSEDFIVTVTIPIEANCYAVGETIVEVFPESDPSIKDIAFIETAVSPIGKGNVVGQVLDVNTGLGIQNAYAYLEIGDVYTETWTSPEGHYMFNNVFACDWEGKFEAFGYYGQSGVSMDVPAGFTKTLDISLDAPWPKLSDASVNVFAPEEITKTITLSVNNLGTGDLTFYVSEVKDEAIYPKSTLSYAIPKGIDPQVYEDIADSVEGSADFIVYMAEQADLSAAFKITDWNERGEYVLDALKTTAERTQAILKTFLNDAGLPFESRYIVNALVVHGDYKILSDIASHPDVAFIGPNTAIDLPKPVETVTSFDVTDSVVWNIEKVRADDVWTDFGATGMGVVVSNIDTGVLYTHPALVKQYRGNAGGGDIDHNYNWWDPYDYGLMEPYDWHSHGSHTMGTMLGDDGGSNQIGMAPNATWMACQGFDKNTGYGYNAELLECAEFILAPWDLTGANPMPAMRPHIVNNSWGGGQAEWWFAQVAYAWRAAGIFGVFSAGNSGPSCETIGDPGDMLNMMAVGATDSDDVIAGFSSRGPAMITGILKPNVSAPGVSVISAYNNGAIGIMSGTSMAAPHVAGEAALLWSAEPDLTGDVDMTYKIIEQTSKPLTTTQECGDDMLGDVPNNVYGWGRIDAYEAVSLTLNANWDIPWMSVNPEGGIVMPGERSEIELYFDTSGFDPNVCYKGSLKFDFNDPYVTQAVVPVEICNFFPNFLPIISKK